MKQAGSLVGFTLFFIDYLGASTMMFFEGLSFASRCALCPDRRESLSCLNWPKAVVSSTVVDLTNQLRPKDQRNFVERMTPLRHHLLPLHGTKMENNSLHQRRSLRGVPKIGLRVPRRHQLPLPGTK